MESKRYTKKRDELGEIHQAMIPDQSKTSSTNVREHKTRRIFLNNDNNNKANELNKNAKNIISKEGLKFFYTNADQFVNKRDDLQMLIADDKPDIMMITEVIPKGQINPIKQTLLDVEGYKCTTNFDPDECNLGASGIRGVAIYCKQSLKIDEIEFRIDGFRDHVWIEIPTKNCGSILCGCVYRSPSNILETNKASTKEINKLINMAHN